MPRFLWHPLACSIQEAQQRRFRGGAFEQHVRMPFFVVALAGIMAASREHNVECRGLVPLNVTCACVTTRKLCMRLHTSCHCCCRLAVPGALRHHRRLLQRVMVRLMLVLGTAKLTLCTYLR
jgi:hypothetical protein